MIPFYFSKPTVPLCLEFAPPDNKANQLASKNMFFRSKFEYCDTKKADVLRPSQIMRGQRFNIDVNKKVHSLYGSMNTGFYIFFFQ